VVSGPIEKDARIVAAELTVVSEAARKPAGGPEPGYVIRKAQGPIEIDGRASEDAWKRPGTSPAFTAAEGGPALRGETRARWLWDEQYLYLFVEVGDPEVFSQYKGQDDPLWKEDVVEVFIDADRNRRGYVELQVNPHNAHFDAFFATTRAVKGDESWNSGMRSAVVVHGTLDNRGDTDRGWDLEVAIPLAAVKGQATDMAVTLPPRVGDVWRLNVVQSDKAEGVSGKLMVASWNPITYQDFHALDRMLEVQFGDEAGNVEPKAAAPEAGEGETGEGEAAAAPATGAATPGAGASETPGASKPAGETPQPATPGAAKPGASKPAGETPAPAKSPAGETPAPAKSPAGETPAQPEAGKKAEPVEPAVPRSGAGT